MVKFSFLSLMYVLLHAVTFGQTSLPYDKSNDCTSINITAPIIFKGYNFSQLDTLLIKTYVKDGKYNDVQDSFYVWPHNNHSVNDSMRKSFDIFTDYPLSTGYDFEVTLKNKDVFRVTGITLREMMYGNHSVVCDIVGYTLNGKRLDIGQLIFSKSTAITTRH